MTREGERPEARSSSSASASARAPRARSQRLLGLGVVRPGRRSRGRAAGTRARAACSRAAFVRARARRSAVELPDERRRVAGREKPASKVPLGSGALHGDGARAGATRVPEDPADERDGGDECRRRPCENESRPVLVIGRPTGCSCCRFRPSDGVARNGKLLGERQRRPRSPRRPRGPRCSWPRRRRGSRCR